MIFRKQKIEVIINLYCICSDKSIQVTKTISEMSGYSKNSSRYIPRDDRREDPRDDRREERRPPRYDAYRDDYEAIHGEHATRVMYGDDCDDARRPVTEPSICIPRTFPTIRGEQTKRAIFNTFKDLRIGHIDRIDVVHKTDKNGERYCTVYVHLNWNMRDTLARNTRAKLLGGEEIKIVYDDPWFWKCTRSTIEKPQERYVAGTQHRSTARPRIDLGEGTASLSRYTQERDDRDDRGEHHNQEQLCNMDPEDEE